MKLILHIGTEKTGTTAFQIWMHENTQALRRQGVWYAQAFDVPNNRKLSVIARRPDEREDGFGFYGIQTEADHEAFRDRTLAAFARDVEAARAAGAHTYFVSSEHLHSRLRFQEMVDRTAGIVKPQFDAVEIVCFLRPQIDTALSLASTGARVGMHIDERFFERVKPGNPYYNYPALLERWANAFGEQAVTPVPFVREKRPVEYFKRRLGLDPQADYAPDRRINSTVDYRVVALMNALVRENATNKPRELHPMFRTFFIEELPCEEPLAVGQETAREIQARFDAQNRRLARLWPQISEQDLQPDWSRYGEGNFHKLETADYTPIVRHVIGRFNADLAMQRGRVSVMESRQAEAEGKLDLAIRHQKKAIAQVEQARAVDSMAKWADTQHGHYVDRLERLHALRAAASADPGGQAPSGGAAGGAAGGGAAAGKAAAPEDEETAAGRPGEPSAPPAPRGMLSLLRNLVPRRN
ncbi:hypothetical protein GE300_13025 [Rhodobacteraceae bacterium 2CG4]|uniref:Uncharacterized protein n=1 Tax=Halovulum marinum TaxID=2662447 RepID=A0A6L5Z1W1_9RHOB|nr:hypothetical protein [Halovulum marinum]MSU90527.1 hypothetical protein [Halovulum marinum]